jgi:hypothetical protein
MSTQPQPHPPLYRRTSSSHFFRPKSHTPTAIRKIQRSPYAQKKLQAPPLRLSHTSSPSAGMQKTCEEVPDEHQTAPPPEDSSSFDAVKDAHHEEEKEEATDVASGEGQSEKDANGVEGGRESSRPHSVDSSVSIGFAPHSPSSSSQKRPKSAIVGKRRVRDDGIPAFGRRPVSRSRSSLGVAGARRRRISPSNSPNGDDLREGEPSLSDDVGCMADHDELSLQNDGDDDDQDVDEFMDEAAEDDRRDKEDDFVRSGEKHVAKSGKHTQKRKVPHDDVDDVDDVEFQEHFDSSHSQVADGASSHESSPTHSPRKDRSSHSQRTPRAYRTPRSLVPEIISEEPEKESTFETDEQRIAKLKFQKYENDLKEFKRVMKERTQDLIHFLSFIQSLDQGMHYEDKVDLYNRFFRRENSRRAMEDGMLRQQLDDKFFWTLTKDSQRCPADQFLAFAQIEEEERMFLLSIGAYFEPDDLSDVTFRPKTSRSSAQTRRHASPSARRPKTSRSSTDRSARGWDSGKGVASSDSQKTLSLPALDGKRSEHSKSFAQSDRDENTLVASSSIATSAGGTLIPKLGMAQLKETQSKERTKKSLPRPKTNYKGKSGTQMFQDLVGRSRIDFERVMQRVFKLKEAKRIV